MQASKECQGICSEIYVFKSQNSVSLSEDSDFSKNRFPSNVFGLWTNNPYNPRADGLDSWYTLESNHGITDFPVRTTVARRRWWQWLASRRTLAWTSRPSPAQQQALSSTADAPRDALSIEVLSTAAVRTVWTSCTTNPQQIEVITAERYGRRTCTKTVSVVRV